MIMARTTSSTLAIVLGGGRGTRLYPLTKLRAKPAVPLGGKYRLIDIPISNCINSGLNQIYVLTQFLSVSLHRHVTTTYKFDNFCNGFTQVLAAEQTHTSDQWYQGTANAVKQHLERFIRHDPDDIIILAGDHLYRMDYAAFVQYHRTKHADITVGVIPVATENASRFGILKSNGEGKIVAYREKPTQRHRLEPMQSRPERPRPYDASMGIYVFRMETLRQLLETVEGDDFGHHILPAAVEHHRVFAYPFNGYWADIGTIGAFYDANIALTQPQRPFSFFDEKLPIFTHSRFLPPSRVDDCTLTHSIVAEGCRLNRGTSNGSVIGLRSIIQPECALDSVVMMGADYYESDEERAENRHFGRPDIGIGPGTTINRAILDKNVRIGANVTIRSHGGDPDEDDTEERYMIRDGVVVVPKGAVIEDNVTI